MPLVGTTEMFKKAYQGHYAIGAFNVNNMEIIQGIMEAAKKRSLRSFFRLRKAPAIMPVRNISSAWSRPPFRIIRRSRPHSIWTTALLMRSVRPALTVASLPSCMMARSTPSRKMSKSQNRSSSMHMTKVSWWKPSSDVWPA